MRKLAAIDALARYGAAQPQMLDSITIEPNLWPTSARASTGSASCSASSGIAERGGATRGGAEQILRSRLNFQGTTMTFSTERTRRAVVADGLGRLERECALLAVLDRAAVARGRAAAGARRAGRQQRGHWNTTVANAWGVLAMEKFSAAFESTPVTGATASSLWQRSAQSVDVAARAAAQERVELPWPDGRAALDREPRGPGAPWAIVRATAALPLEKPLSHRLRDRAHA